MHPLIRRILEERLELLLRWQSGDEQQVEVTRAEYEQACERLAQNESEIRALQEALGKKVAA